MDEFLDRLGELDLSTLDVEFIQSVWPAIVELAQNPTRNLPAAILIYGILATLLLIIGIAVVFFILGAEDEEETSASGTGLPSGAAVPKGAARQYVVVVTDPLRYHKGFLVVFLVLLATLIVAGYTTQQDSVCLSCHQGSAHVKYSKTDAHRRVSCARCHDGGGVVASVTLAVPKRATHIVRTIANPLKETGYGTVQGTSCRSCHEEVLGSTIEIEDRALRVSHKEPLEAGAGCTDCHSLDGNEKISGVTLGMGPCLRCHNDTDASAECSVCHEGDVSKAVAARHAPSQANAKQLVPNPSCYSCHDPRPCDACHGIRLPHAEGYAFHGHQKDAARDLWNNGGATCYSCHTDERRTCYRVDCHEINMPTHGFMPGEHALGAGSLAGDCDMCHNRRKLFKDTCAMCHDE